MLLRDVPGPVLILVVLATVAGCSEEPTSADDTDTTTVTSGPELCSMGTAGSQELVCIDPAGGTGGSGAGAGGAEGIGGSGAGGRSGDGGSGGGDGGSAPGGSGGAAGLGGAGGAPGGGGGEDAACPSPDEARAAVEERTSNIWHIGAGERNAAGRCCYLVTHTFCH